MSTAKQNSSRTSVSQDLPSSRDTAKVVIALRADGSAIVAPVSQSTLDKARPAAHKSTSTIFTKDGLSEARLVDAGGVLIGSPRKLMPK